jgi:CRISPR-associated endonuclease/helicase Cas3
LLADDGLSRHVTGLSVDDFPLVFERIHGHSPFRWQSRLLREVDERGWPGCVAAPTGAGKTAVLDIALYHLALERLRASSPRRAPMRIVFAVDRRIIVDQAFERARKIRDALSKPADGALKRVADALGGPIHVEEIRGGIPREDDWARTPVQPTILCATVDQVGSRLLFRGYGVSESMAPVHAGLLGQDALILLDEAHLSAAFEETLKNIDLHRKRAHSSQLFSPWATCALTATPRRTGTGAFQLDTQERAEIAKRLSAKKSAQLVKVDHDAGSPELADVFVEWGLKLADKRLGSTIAIVVNRVALARAIHERLKRAIGDHLSGEAGDEIGAPAENGNARQAILLTGRVRPLERDRLIEEYGPRLFSGRASDSDDPPLFVVATQCIEAGADFDFDAIATQMAPLDCLRQRFGRLDRLGWHGPTEAVVLAAKDAIAKTAEPDPIYGEAVRRTWDWLNAKGPEPAKGQGKRLDFGPDAIEELIARDPDGARACMPEAKSAPVLRTADVEFFTMTHPRPHPDPHLPLFLHGDSRVETDVSIVWRADLPDDLDETAKGIVACLPPRAAEALAVPLWEARQWLAGRAEGAVGDVEGAERESDDRQLPNGRRSLRWRGAEDAETGLVEGRQLRPGDLIVVPASYGGCDRFGWAPKSVQAVADLADAAAEPYERRRAILRLHPKLWPLTEPCWGEVARLLQDLKEESAQALFGALGELAPADSEIRARLDRFVRARLDPPLFPYDGDEEPEAPTGVVLIAPRGLKGQGGARESDEDGLAEAVTDGGDAGSFRTRPLPLEKHLADVEAKAREFAQRAGLSSKLVSTVVLAARLHDMGKADPRFQTYLAGGAEPSEPPLAKSGRRFAALDAATRAASGLPDSWRHEALSVRVAARQLDPMREDVDAGLALFLIGSHHGHGRPFFRHSDPWDECERSVAGKILPAGGGPERLDFDWHGRDWAELFEELNHRYGAWGLAYLEAVFRLSDHRASEDAEKEGA